MRKELEKYYDLVYRNSLRILCDRQDADEMVSHVLASVQKQEYGKLSPQNLEDMILRRTCMYCRMRLVYRQIKCLFGEQINVFVKAVPKADNRDDYTVKQAWQLFCRASFKMTPMQCVIYSLVELDRITLERVVSILGITSLRARIALARASKMVYNELSFYDSGNKYAAFVGFIRIVR